VAHSLGVWLHTFDSSAPLNGMMTACGSLVSIHSLILDNLEEKKRVVAVRVKLCDHATKPKRESRLLANARLMWRKTLVFCGVCVCVCFMCDGWPLVLLANVVSFREVNEVDDWLCRKKQVFVQHLNLHIQKNITTSHDITRPHNITW